MFTGIEVDIEVDIFSIPVNMWESTKYMEILFFLFNNSYVKHKQFFSVKIVHQNFENKK